MPKKDYGEAIGKCSICTINLWSSTDGLPVVWPCNIKDCPYEDSSEQHAHHHRREFGVVGSGIGQIL
mgnify:FL=1|tara:strand:+ start:827 stop:1027 length:201 start_codon:yes stop_codon:yes gene_type:complete